MWCLRHYAGVCCLGNSEPSAADADLSVSRVRAAGPQVISGRLENCSSGPVPSFSYCVHLGRHLLHGQPKRYVPHGETCDRWITLWGVSLGDDELRCGASFGHPSLATPDRPCFHNHRAYWSHVAGGAADRACGAQVLRVTAVPGAKRVTRTAPGKASNFSFLQRSIYRE